jgi:Transposase
MMIIGCDLHTRYQQIAMLDTDTGELVERRLEHENGEARAFYGALVGPVRVGIEATGSTHWFEAMLAEMGHELWVGDAAQMRALVVRKQKTDTRDAAHALDLLPGAPLLAWQGAGAWPVSTHRSPRNGKSAATKFPPWNRGGSDSAFLLTSRCQLR